MLTTVFHRPTVAGTITGHWGAHIALHEDDYRPLQLSQTGLPQEGNFANATGGAGSGGPSGSTYEGVAGDGASPGWHN